MLFSLCYVRIKKNYKTQYMPNTGASRMFEKFFTFFISWN
jgi:hypothetical protein